jgi:alkanesulfonate monooxygenase SsuD/methylene tetrahydromethanopterin reductase-like flavin-dependent oxidoreductase (luciferase family)
MPGAARKNAQLVRQLGLEEYLGDRFAVAGTQDDCLRQIERAAGAGANQLWMSIYFPDKLRFIEEWAKIISRFA